ncbi:MAG TPA: acyl-phosphate glycerol 3-phosphate acyltransferase [Lachnospiraceae bacterium]|nr:acyl-phosphate glycerol 3-phosphate acyltransferase [Lachnospiraceae bacterium]
MIVIRVLCLVIGYCFGLIATGVLYGKLAGVDLREHGSGNSGTTNALRVMGFKAGLVVFLGDFLKSFIPCLICRLIFKNIYPDTYLLYVIYVGFGAVLGHIFPFYLGFKGGKGIATIGGTVVGLLQPLMIIILLILFVSTIAITKYMSVGSISLMVEFVIVYIIFGLKGLLCFDMSVAQSKAAFIESVVVAVLFASLAIYKHKANIIRLINHEENKFHFKKQEGV